MENLFKAKFQEKLSQVNSYIKGRPNSSKEQIMSAILFDAIVAVPMNRNGNEETQSVSLDLDDFIQALEIVGFDKSNLSRETLPDNREVVKVSMNNGIKLCVGKNETGFFIICVKDGRCTSFNLPLGKSAVNLLYEVAKSVDRLSDEYDRISLKRSKREKAKEVNSATAKIFIEDALKEQGRPFKVQYNDCRAVVKVKLSTHNRMVVLNVLYKNLYEEIEMLKETIEQIDQIVKKFGRYTFICSSKGTAWDWDGQENSQEELQSATEQVQESGENAESSIADIPDEDLPFGR